jgi:hypothetical protein
MCILCNTDALKSYNVTIFSLPSKPSIAAPHYGLTPLLPEYSPILHLYRHDPVGRTPLSIVSGRPRLCALRARVIARSSSWMTMWLWRGITSGQGWIIQFAVDESAVSATPTSSAALTGSRALVAAPLLAPTGAWAPPPLGTAADALLPPAPPPAAAADAVLAPRLARLFALPVSAKLPSSCLLATALLKPVMARSSQPRRPAFSAASYKHVTE